MQSYLKYIFLFICVVLFFVLLIEVFTLNINYAEVILFKLYFNSKSPIRKYNENIDFLRYFCISKQNRGKNLLKRNVLNFFY